jgi:hypothetical protein
MKKSIQLLLIFFAVSMLNACAPRIGSPEARVLIQKKIVEQKTETVETTTDKTPKWCNNLPSSDVALYACGTGMSSNLNIAQSRSLIAAKRKIADQIQGEYSGLMEEFVSAIGGDSNEQIQQQFQIASSNIIVSTKLAGYKTPKNKTIDEEGKFIHYLLIEYPVGAANSAIMQELRKNELLSTQENSEKAMAKLEAEIEKRRNR